ncbi:MAG: glycosyl hydrolase [Bacteroidetes bacterium B1(2017)]|nr:MAG: glycosyl hydrolase [Bacteroidetes bacterium B1(2017)]
MKKTISMATLAVLLTVSMGFLAKKPKWVSLFDGKTLNGWKVGENAASFKVEDGAIVVNGPVGHLFYDGSVGNHDFKNFEFKAKVMTMPGSNSGLYFHTKYQEKSWPSKGYEVQVNNSHTDWKRTASLYDIKDVKETYVKDNEWYTETILVQGKHIITKINDQVVVDYTEPDNIDQSKGRKLSSGTFAIQAHDPKSKVFVKDIMVKILPD